MNDSIEKPPQNLFFSSLKEIFNRREANKNIYTHLTPRGDSSLKTKFYANVTQNRKFAGETGSWLDGISQHNTNSKQSSTKYFTCDRLNPLTKIKEGLKPIRIERLNKETKQRDKSYIF